MNGFEKLIEIAKSINPDFDEKNAKDLDKVVVSFIIASKDSSLKEKYLEEVVAAQEREKLSFLIKGLTDRCCFCESILDTHNFEKEVIDTKIKVLKEFMN